MAVPGAFALPSVEAIPDAAAQVLEERGYARGTTNRIAERAGVSIESLYEDFPNKDAIGVALAERMLEAGREGILSFLEVAQAREGLPVLLRRFVEAIVDFHPRSPALHHTLIDEAAHSPDAHSCMLRFEESLARTLEGVLRRRRLAVWDPVVAAHFVVQTAESLAHRFVPRGIHKLDQSMFVEEVTRLLAHCLGPPSRLRARSWALIALRALAGLSSASSMPRRWFPPPLLADATSSCGIWCRAYPESSA